jgi:nucleotide-binding universal stress UspA family protein
MRTVLAALDGTARADDVLRIAADVAARYGARLIPFRAVLVPPDIAPAAHVDHGDPLPAKMRSDAVQALRVKCAALGVSFDEPVVREGSPARAILAVADELDIDLVVIGSHGFHGLDRVFGTTAGAVANMARCNVLVVHEGDAGPGPALGGKAR